MGVRLRCGLESRRRTRGGDPTLSGAATALHGGCRGSFASSPNCAQFSLQVGAPLPAASKDFIASSMEEGTRYLHHLPGQDPRGSAGLLHSGILFEARAAELRGSCPGGEEAICRAAITCPTLSHREAPRRGDGYATGDAKATRFEESAREAWPSQHFHFKARVAYGRPANGSHPCGCDRG